MKLLAIALLALPLLCAPPEPSNLQIFLLIGQSNMAGRGLIEEQDKLPIPRVVTLSKEMAWTPAVDPLHFDKPQIAGVGLGRSFAKVLGATDPGASIGLVPAAFGGTSLDEWKPEGQLYKEALRRAKFAMRSGKLRGILWHQGEADSGTQVKASSYDERFAQMIQTLRTDLNAADVPVIVGELGEFRYTDPKSKDTFERTVNEQLALVPLRVPHSAFVSSAGLTSNPDHIHFDARSQREFGRRYALAFLSLDPSWQPGK